LREGEWSLAYQSRFGKERWLQPYTVDTLDALAERGIRTVDVACPGFAADCLETLEEIAIGLRARVSAWRHAALHPCLNDDADHAAALAALAERSLGT
jgi:ferrochelatase